MSNPKVERLTNACFRNEIIVKSTKYLQFPTSVSDFYTKDSTVQDRRCYLTFI